MERALADPNSGGQFFLDTQKAAVTEDLGLWDYAAAGATGIYHGAALQLPEQSMRVLHRLSSVVGAKDMQEFARNKLDEYQTLREEDPYWQPDARWNESYFARSLYEGFQSSVSSLAFMLPGIALAPVAGAAGAAGIGIHFLMGATSGGVLAGIAEYDSFMDDAYRELGALNPNITREDIEDEQFWNALMSGFAEGGFEFAGDVLGGHLMGLMGKGVLKPAAGQVIDTATRQLLENQVKANVFGARNVLGKLMKNVTHGIVSNVPSEMATAATQDWIRENAGMDSQGRWNAMLAAIGPAAVSGAAFGAAGTPFAMAREGVQAQKYLNQIDPATNTISPAVAASELNRMAHDFQQAYLQDQLGEVGFNFAQENILNNGNLSEAQAQTLALAINEKLKAETVRTGVDVDQQWRNFKAEDYQTLQGVVTDITTAGMTTEQLVQNNAENLVRGLNESAQDALIQNYAVQDDAGGFGIDLDALSADLNQWLKDPSKVDAPAEVQNALADMSGDILAGYEGTRQRNTAPKSGELVDTLKAAAKRKNGTEVPRERPKLYQPRDASTLENAVREIAANPAATNADIAKTIAQQMQLNLNPWTLPSDAQAIFATVDAALADVTEPIRRKISDEVRLKEATADMEANGYTQEGIDSLYGDVVGSAEGTFSERLAKAILYQNILIENVTELARAYDATPTAEAGMELRMGIELYKGIHTQMRGLRAESGRGLRLWAQLGKDGRLDLHHLNEMFDQVGGHASTEKIVSAVLSANVDGTKNVQKALNATMWDRTQAMIVEHMTLGMVSNAPTHIVNTAGNFMTLFNEVWNRFVGQTLSTDTNGIVSGEVGAMLSSVPESIRGIREIWTKHRQDYKSLPSAIYNIDKLQWNLATNSTIMDDAGIQNRALTYENARGVLDPLLPGGDVPALSSAHDAVTGGLSTAIEYYGRALGLVGKSLLTADQFFKTVAFNMEKAALNHRRATQAAGVEGGPTYEAALRQLQARPFKEDVAAAMRFAKKVTFQDDLGKIGSGINRIRSEVPITRVVIPFLKTPINILKYGLAHTPVISQFVDTVRQELNSQNIATRQLAEARVMTGTLMWASALGLATQGFLTGAGPQDPETRKQLEATGWQANSLRIPTKDGDIYFGLDRFDPGAFIFNTAASFVEISEYLSGEDAEQASMAAIAVAVQTVTDRTYLESVSNFLDAVTQLDASKGQAAARNVINSLVIPASGLARGVARGIDPVAREADTVFNSIRASIPGLSRSVPERRNFLGEVVDQRQQWGTNFLSPVRKGRDKQDPVYDEVARLSLAGYRMPTTPNRTWTAPGGGRKGRLDAAQMAAYMRLSGTEYRINNQTMKEHLNRVVTSAGYAQATDEQRAAIINSAVSTYRTRAKSEMMRGDPGVRYLLGL